MGLTIKRDNTYAESNVTVVGITKAGYGRPQYVLVNSDEGETEKLKFPGLRFRSPLKPGTTLEDMAQSRFEEQTGLSVSKMLGLRTIVPTRSRHGGHWIFRNVFFALIDDAHQHREPDGKRKVYLADTGQGTSMREEWVIELGNARAEAPLEWAAADTPIVARIATNFINHFNWNDNSSTWYKEIPCVGGQSLAEKTDRPLGCGLSVASMMLFYQPSPEEQNQIILLRRKGDKYPGYAGGKIETLNNSDSTNLDPISCCIEEGAQEYGFAIHPRALICCACTPLDVPTPDEYYNSIVTYAFVAEPANLRKVKEALENPREHLEGKMESYVVEDLDEHRDRIRRGELRMPDMVSIGEQFYRTTPGEKVPLTHILPSGCT